LMNEGFTLGLSGGSLAPLTTQGAS